jgi:phosphatidylglycerophosphate synthase
MLDAFFRRKTDGYLTPVAARLASLGIRADMLTLVAFACGAVAVLGIGHRNYLVALGFLVAARLLDMLDGPVARRSGVTVFGAYLAFVLDLVAAAAVPFAFALAEPDRALAAMFLMLGLVARAGAAAGAARPDSAGAARAALHRAGQLVGKSELFAAFALACIFPSWFSLIAYAVGILCFVGAGSRLAAVSIMAPS